MSEILENENFMDSMKADENYTEDVYCYDFIKRSTPFSMGNCR